MARRKKQLLSDDDLDSSGSDNSQPNDDAAPDWDEDPDERAERLKFSDPYGRRNKGKRKRDGREDALYGVFAEEQEGEETGHRSGAGGSRGGNGGSRGNKALRRTQAFVPSTASTNLAGTEDTSTTTEHDKPMDLEDAIPLPEPVATTETAASSDEEEASGSDESSSSDEDDDKPEKPRIPRNRDEEIDTDDKEVLAAAMSNDGKSGAQRGGIGARSRGGIGSMARSAAATLVPEPTSTTTAGNAPVASTSAATPPVVNGDTTLQSASGTPEPAAARERRSFLTGGQRAGTPTSGLGMGARKAPAPISKEEQKHFSKLATQGSFGFKLLSKMGWNAGSGLGATGEGIVTPIESKLRPKAMGLAFEGFKERTKQSKEEEKRRKGETGSATDSEEDVGRRKRKGKAAGKDKDGKTAAAPAWKQPKARKAKVQHMTYEQILAQQQSSSSSSAMQGGVGVIYDLAGNQLPTAALSGSAHIHDVPTSDATRLPELRHNLAIISDSTKGDLDNLAREAKNMEDRKRWLVKEESRIRMAVESDAARIARLEEITAATSTIQKLSSSLGAYDPRPPSSQLALFSESFEKLLSIATAEEYELYRLDEVVVGAISPILKRAWMEWDVLADPTAYLEDLRIWKKAYRLQKRDVEQGNGMEVDIFGSSSYVSTLAGARGKQREPQRSMTAFESMLWTIWMPRLRSAINNDWSPSHPTAVITLFSSWKASGLLPRFISDNILDQLVLPKLRKAIENWMPPRSKSYSSSSSREKEKEGKKDPPAGLHHIVFPWLEHAGEERMEEIMAESKRRIRGWLKTWKARDGVPEGLQPWRDVIPKSEWDNLVLQNVVPQLSAHLREKFHVNPRQQDLAPLEMVLSWRPLLRSSILSQILETGFFTKFLDALYTWLTAASVNYEQVAEWYTWWRKEVFGTESRCDSLPGVERGFAKALDMMNQAMAMGEDAKYRLKKPDVRSLAASSSSNGSSHRYPEKEGTTKHLKGRQQDTATDVTFRSVVEEYAAEANLIMVPTGRSHDISGMPLFRVSPTVEGKGGVTVYLQGDVVYAQNKEGNWRPIGVQDMVERGRKAAA